MRENPRKIWGEIAGFLDVEENGFAPALEQVNSAQVNISEDFQRQTEELEPILKLNALSEKLTSLSRKDEGESIKRLNLR